MPKIINSIGRKIFIIVLCSLIAITLMVFISLTFFTKIGKIGNIKQIAFQYELMIKNSSIAFNRYIVTEDPVKYEKLVKILNRAILLDGRLGDMDNIFKKGHSNDEAIKIYTQMTGTDPLKIKDGMAGNRTLLSTPYAPKILKVTGSANEMSTTLLKLVKQYAETKSSDQKKKIEAELNAIYPKMRPTLQAFYDVLGEVSDYFAAQIKKIFMIIFTVTVLLISTVAFFITRSITKPLEKTVAYTKTIASGKFKEDLNIKSNDELGIMVMSMNTMRKSLRDMIKEIMSGISQLNNSANDLTGFSDQVSQMAVENADKANSVSAATEEMSTNMDMVAENMETSSMNTDSVVTAVEEMTSTINEIAQNTDRAMRITEQAVEQSQAASNHMNQLGEVAQDIGKVTEVINGISEQTNMLSLNATIEAARAGENGKGFAVVAGEIKALADLTARSTKDIRGQIEKIQSSTKNSIEEIDVVSKIISEVSMIVTTIATALEEQSIATSEIASNIAVVSQRITEVSGSVTESSAVTKEITQSVADIHMSTDEMSGNSDQVKNSAKGLSDLAIKLDALMKNFTI